MRVETRGEDDRNGQGFESQARGVLLDMDGVLVDSEPILRDALSRLFGEKGVEVRAADSQPFLGTGEDHLLEDVAAEHGVAPDLPRDLDRLYGIYLELIPGRLKALPGVFTFLAEARRRHLRVPLASSAAAVKVEANLREAGLAARDFDAVVDARDVRQKKPHPDIFVAQRGACAYRLRAASSSKTPSPESRRRRRPAAVAWR